MAMTQMLELPDEDFRAAIIKMLQQTIMHTWNKWKSLSKEVESLNKELGDIRKTNFKF